MRTFIGTAVLIALLALTLLTGMISQKIDEQSVRIEHLMVLLGVTDEHPEGAVMDLLVLTHQKLDHIHYVDIEWMINTLTPLAEAQAEFHGQGNPREQNLKPLQEEQNTFSIKADNL